MLKEELNRRVSSYNASISSIRFQMPDMGALKSQINELKEVWDTPASAEVISQLNEKYADLESKVEQLNSYITQLKESNISFTFNKEKIGTLK